ncbi:hypothetical protein AK88_05206 [Plasmodium fragile]|uniref:Schizont-infected cell agglutination C-terminal domain-containing protein n=1 Tax=Plasmodium fragile TaxID=5857 RepID=A0A0D9QDT6_PLAFR|nr:uncharacterized protein AK88_05206 [Plasmodium fragile]KJP85163.1 hypothetical protein AK88_05206 [Plasmodium fragile]
MTLALFFANKEGKHGNSEPAQKTHDDILYEKFRCEVANVFGYMLKNQYCKHNPGWKRGVEYAWKTLQEMGKDVDGNKGLTGPVMDGRCTQCGYDGSRTKPGIINGEIAEWFLTEGIMGEIAQMERDMPCADKWDTYKKKNNLRKGDTIQDILQQPGIKNMKDEEHTIIQKAKKVFKEAEKKVQEEIVRKEAEDKDGTTPVAAAGAQPAGPDASGGTSNTQEAAVDAAANTDTGTHSSTTHKEDPELGTVTIHTTVTTTPYISTRGVDPTALEKLADAQATGHIKQHPDSVTPQRAQDPQSPAAEGPPEAPAEAAPTTPGQKDTEVTTNEQIPPKGESGSASESTASNPDALGTGAGVQPEDPDQKNTIVDGGNDDPPPLNPPKPKPNPNPDQSGSSGSFSDADLADGVSGGKGKAGGADGAGQPGSSETGSSGAQNPGSSGPGSPGTGATGTHGAGSPPSGGPATQDNNQVVGIGIVAFFLWKYFAHLGKQRRRTYRTVRDVPSPPLHEDILQHLQRGELPTPDYGYTMITQPASAAARRRRPPRVHKRTIIELHLEVLNECAATEWENVKADYSQIVVQQFAQDLMRDEDTNNSMLGVSTTNEGPPGTNVSYTDSDGTDICPPNEDEPDPWSCMETTQLATDPCPPNDSDPWNCMENIQLDTEPDPHSSPRNECPIRDHTYWINWIDRNKHLLQQCTTQPWFLQLTLAWKQYLREHMAADADNGQRAFGEAPTPPMKKLDAWKAWVAKQHALMNIYGEEEWFQRLLQHIEEETASQNGEVPVVEHVMPAADLLQVRNLSLSQPLHPQPYMTKPVTATTWILILALVIEQCELESRLQETELYVDALLQNMRH